MDTSLTLIFVAIFIPQAISQVLTWGYWWQQKEYRFDRFKVLVGSQSGRTHLGFVSIALKIAILLLSPIATLPLLAYVILDGKALLLVFSRMQRRPALTQRMKKILGVVCGGQIILFALVFLGVYRIETILVFAELYLVVGILGGILWTKPVVDTIKKSEIQKAQAKLKELHPKVIGITGSYGKSTTKEFLAHILSSQFITEKTNKNQNNEFGVARKIINDFDQKAEIFVAEMGAYTKNEIRTITEFTHPDIGIITGLEPQHLELFGSYKAILTAKFELIESLPDGALAVFNVSNKDCEMLAKRASKLPTHLKVARYRLVDSFKKQSRYDARSKIIKTSKDGVVFDFSMKGIKKRFTVPIAGGHFVENLTGAIYVARELGVTWKHIEKSLKTIQTPVGTMSTYSLTDGTFIIDDSANATPRGFTAALNFIDTFSKKKRILVTSGIIELGVYSHTIHQDLGEVARKKVDAVVLTNPDFAVDLAKGLGRESEKLIVEQDPSKLIKSIALVRGPETVILLEGRLPSKLKQYIEANS